MALGLGLGIQFTNRVGGAPPFNPSQIAGLVLWLDSSQGINLVGGKIDTWEDQSPLGNDAFALSAANRVTYNASNSGFNNKPTYSPASIEEALNLTNAITLSNYTVLWVSKKATTENFNSIILGQFNNGGVYFGDDVDNVGNPSAYGGPAGPLNTFGLGNSKNSGGENVKHLSFSRRNGISVLGGFNNTNYGPSNISSQPFIFDILYYYSLTSTYNYIGDIAEIIIYNNSVSDSDLLLLRTYLNSKYLIW
jgi:hypothetical protein